MSNEPNKNPIPQLAPGDELSRGRYCNNMLVIHSPEEFLIDWLLNSPTGTYLIARTIVSPGHLKRIVNTLAENLKNYEDKYGKITAIQPKEQKFQ